MNTPTRLVLDENRPLGMVETIALDLSDTSFFLTRALFLDGLLEGRATTLAIPRLKARAVLAAALACLDAAERNDGRKVA
jgi:hypothetical protein